MVSFEDRLKSFVFFHLGSDAEMELESGSGILRVRLAHSRIHPIEFALPAAETAALAADPERFEDYLLDLLTRYRKARGERKPGGK